MCGGDHVFIFHSSLSNFSAETVVVSGKKRNDQSQALLGDCRWRWLTRKAWSGLERIERQVSDFEQRAAGTGQGAYTAGYRRHGAKLGARRNQCCQSMRSRVRKELTQCTQCEEILSCRVIRCARSKHFAAVVEKATEHSPVCVPWIRNLSKIPNCPSLWTLFRWFLASSSNMDENLSRGYVQLGKARGMNEFKFSNGFTHLSPPVDKCNFIYMALILGGIGFLLPYNRSCDVSYLVYAHIIQLMVETNFISKAGITTL